jgi:esterase/lipase superfamily enzyme
VQVEERSWFSDALGQDMALKVYGHSRPAAPGEAGIRRRAGAWEDDMLADTRAMRDVLAAKGIPAIGDEWGDDVNHDWPWWRKMLPHYLDRLGV